MRNLAGILVLLLTHTLGQAMAFANAGVEVSASYGYRLMLSRKLVITPSASLSWISANLLVTGISHRQPAGGSGSDQRRVWCHHVPLLRVAIASPKRTGVPFCRSSRHCTASEPKTKIAVEPSLKRPISSPFSSTTGCGSLKSRIFT